MGIIEALKTLSSPFVVSFKIRALGFEGLP